MAALLGPIGSGIAAAPLAAAGEGADAAAVAGGTQPLGVALPLLLALGTAIAAFLAPTDRLRRAVALVGSLGYLAAVAWLVRAVLSGGPLAYRVSAWRPPLGIVLVADALAVAFLALIAVVAIAALAAALCDPPDAPTYHPLSLFLLAGATGAVLTGDLFNLFVWFEVLLIASYGLVGLPNDAAATRAALRYAVLNLIGGAVMLVAVGGFYATAGTLTMADLARRLAAPAAWGIDTAPVLGLAGLLIAVFALKAGLVPFHFWAPAAYRAAPAPAAALLAGAAKAVGVYAILRLTFTVLGPLRLSTAAGGPLAGGRAVGAIGIALLVLAVASILLGGVAALGADDFAGLLTHSSIGQLGFVVLPIGIAAVAASVTTATVRTAGATGGDIVYLGIAAAVVYTIAHGLAKAALFILDGALGEWAGTTHLDALGGLAHRSPAVAGAFLLAALTLVGVPPLAGFFGKLFVLETALGGPRPLRGSTLAVALGGAVLTIGYVSRAWSAIFWGRDGPAVSSTPPRTAYVALALASTLLVFGVGFGPLGELATAAAEATVDTAEYVGTVDPAPAAPPEVGDA
jgi:multicomponent Na+:H+ antiporter subunit D